MEHIYMNTHKTELSLQEEEEEEEEVKVKTFWGKEKRENWIGLS